MHITVPTHVRGYSYTSRFTEYTLCICYISYTWFMICPNERSYKYFHRNFATIWSFTASHFHHSHANIFLQKLVSTFYLKLCPNLLESIFGESVDLGIHTNVIVYTTQGAIHEYSWGHPKTRPYGVPLPLNCGGCGRLGSWIVSDIPLTALPTTGEFPCSGPGCSHVFSSHIPALNHFGSKCRDASGEWFIRCLKGLDSTSQANGTNLKWVYEDEVFRGSSVRCKGKLVQNV